jgi:UDP-hydrolysing UDP-N-acetyl-D-glucosamine 2-epimerase
LNILAVTGSRADWGLLHPVLARLRGDSRFDLRLAVTGQHLAGDALSLSAIESDGFLPDHRIDMQLGDDDGDAAVAAATGRCLAGFGAVLAADRPDLLLVLGDRYEIHAAVTAALLARVPVAHLCGGDVTEGAMDDSLRHSITKMSSLHFATNAESAARIVQLGEAPDHVFDVGSPGLDRIRRVQLFDRDTLFAQLGLAPRPRNLLVTFHPVTLDARSECQCRAMLDALAGFDDTGLIFTGSNADPGARAIDRMVETFAASHPHAVFHRSLGSRRYFSALAAVDAVVGNSSSGLYEAPSFAVPTVNIGDRQARRPRATSVIDCAPATDAITAAIRAALAKDCTAVVNPYGDGHAAERIVATLATVDDPARLVRKSFRDLPQ